MTSSIAVRTRSRSAGRFLALAPVGYGLKGDRLEAPLDACDDKASPSIEGAERYKVLAEVRPIKLQNDCVAI
jgi:hypothetical protein